jgi:hypothetical protein
MPNISRQNAGSKPKWLGKLVGLHWFISTLPLFGLAAIFLLSFRVAALTGTFPIYNSVDQPSTFLEQFPNDGLLHGLDSFATIGATIAILAPIVGVVFTSLMFYFQYRYAPQNKFRVAFLYGLIHMIVLLICFQLFVNDPTARLDWFLD